MTENDSSSDDSTESLLPASDGVTGLPSRSGTRVGPYKLLSILGEGGFGVVYLAEQEHPIRRRVAMKIIKPGMDTKQVLARFEAERQALALMDHPNIARVLDAGATEAGRPYFVMELVHGEPITEYCDRHKLTIEQRLKLLIPVCHAVQHAHQKGVIHRDLKPTNILVAILDEQPLPKIIDFGVAKATAQPLTERTLYTERGQLIGTPEYMSPEQAEMSAVDVDTRTDIYSLGVLLYELLTGALPFGREELHRAGFGEIQRIIRDVDPPRPSTKLSTMGEESGTFARQRQADPRSLRRLLHGDLDWITMKALEKDRARRYATADGLADDLRRHLTHEPVEAGPPGAAYRLGKLARKYRVPLVAIALTSLVLVGWAATSMGLYFSAERHRVRAERAAQAARAAHVAEREERDRAHRMAREAEEKSRKAKLALARSLCQEGAALGMAEDWGGSKARYREAYGILESEKASAVPVDLGLAEAFSHAPPPLYRLAFPGAGDRSVVALSRSAERMAASSTNPHAVTIWDAPTSVRLQKVLVDAEVTGMDFSPSGEMIAVSTKQADTYVYLAEKGTLISRFTTPKLTPSEHHVQPVFGPDERIVLTVSDKGQGALCHWDAHSGRLLRRWGIPGDFLNRQCCSLARSADGNAIAAGWNGYVTVWRWPQAKPLVIDVPTWAFTTALSTDGQMGVAGSSDREVWGWRWNTGSRTRVDAVPWPDGGVGHLLLSPAGDCLLGSTMRRCMRARTRRTGRLMRSFTGSGRQFAIEWDQCVIVTVSGEGLAVWPIDVHEPQAASLASELGPNRITLSQDGLLAASSRAGEGGEFPGSAVDIWDVSTGHRIATLKDEDGWKVSRAVLLAGHSVALTVSDCDAVLAWDLVTGKARCLQLMGGKVRHLAVSQSEKLFGFHASYEALAVLDIERGLIVARGSSGRDLRGMALLPGGRKLLESVREGPIRVRRIEDGLPEAFHISTPDRVSTMSIARGGTWIVAGHHTGELSTFPVSANASPRRKSAANHSGEVTRVCVADRASLVASGGSDDTIRLWNLDTLEQVGQFTAPRLSDIAITPDGRYLMSVQGPLTSRRRYVHTRDLALPGLCRREHPRVAEALHALSSNAKDGPALQRLADWYALRGAWAWAAILYKRAVDCGEKVPLLAIARCHWQMGNCDEAIAAFQSAAEAGEAPEYYVKVCIAAARREREGMSNAFAAGIHWDQLEPIGHRLSKAVASLQWKEVLSISAGDFGEVGKKWEPCSGGDIWTAEGDGLSLKSLGDGREHCLRLKPAMDLGDFVRLSFRACAPTRETRQISCRLGSHRANPRTGFWFTLNQDSTEIRKMTPDDHAALVSRSRSCKLQPGKTYQCEAVRCGQFFQLVVDGKLIVAHHEAGAPERSQLGDTTYLLTWRPGRRASVHFSDVKVQVAEDRDAAALVLKALGEELKTGRVDTH